MKILRTCIASLLFVLSPACMGDEESWLGAWASPGVLSFAADAPVHPEASTAPLSDPKTVMITIAADGQTILSESPEGPPTATVPSTADMEKEGRGFEALREALRKLTTDPRLRFPDGRSKLRVLLLGSRSARWSRFLHVRSLCTDPRLKIDRVSLLVRLDDSEPAQRLGHLDFPPLAAAERLVEEVPGEDDATAAERIEIAGRVVALRFFRKSKELPDQAFTRIRVGREFIADGPKWTADDRTHEAEWAPVIEKVSSELQAAVTRRVAAGHPKPAIELRAPPPDGPATPYRDVVRLLRLLGREKYDVQVQTIAYPRSPEPKASRDR